MQLPHEAGPDVIHELALNLYPSSLESFREMISNAADEGSKRCDISVSLNQIIIEDWGQGIDDLDSFRKYGIATKANLGGEIIGSKGLGKLSILRLGTTVDFRTNNGRYGMSILMTSEGFKIDTGAATEFLQHKGTRIVIPNPVDVPPIEEMTDYLRKTFGLRIANGLELTVNDITLTSKVEKGETFLFRLHGGLDVTGNLKQDKRAHGQVDAYVKHVFVASVIVDPERSFAGWVNCNNLTPTTNRNDIVKDKIYKDFIEHLKQFVSKFPKREEDIGRSEITLGQEISKLLKSYLKSLKLYPEGEIPVSAKKVLDEAKNILSTSTDKSEILASEKAEKNVAEYSKLRTSIQSDKPVKRRLDTRYGFQVIYQDFGNEKEPIFLIPPNIIVMNRTNDLYKFTTRKNKNLGPAWLRILPYLARAAISVHPDSRNWSVAETNLQADRATMFFLQQKELLR